jgi:hypothetical protein
MVKDVPEFAAPDHSLSEQTEIAHAMNIPPYNPDASKPGYIRTAAERRRDGDLPRSNEPQESRDELIAHYYGYPNAAAHAAALAAQKTEVKGVSVERAPTPANPDATTNAATNKKKPTVMAGTAAPVRPGPQVRTPIEVSQHDINQAKKKPSAGTKTATPIERRKAHGATAG